MQDQNSGDREVNRTDWNRRMEDQAASGLTIRAYCRDHGLRESAFYYHKKRHQGCFPTGGFVQIPVRSSPIRLRNLDGQWCIEVDRGFDAKLLRELLGVLRP